MTAPTTLRLHRDGPVLRIELARPEVRNAMSLAMVHELRTALHEADRVIAASVHMPASGRSATARIDAVVLHPVAGPLILLGLLFAMFQAVFAWATPFADALEGGVAWLSDKAAAALPRAKG